jgi:formylglycine-generating enzyme required for sulfatase activity
MLATEAGHTEIIRLLKKADAKAQALRKAAAEGDTGEVIALVGKGADVNAKGKHGRTALIEAAGGGHIETVRVLLEKGADVNPTDEKYGFSALEFALGKGHGEIAALLKEAGAGQPKENEFPPRRQAGAETETRVGEAMEALEVGKAESIQQRDIGAKNENMVLIPAGEFLMGSPPGEGSASERPQHKVYLNSFYIDKYEVINSWFKKFVDATGYVTDAERRGWSFTAVRGSPNNKVADANWRHPRGPGSDILEIMDHPVVQVTWNDAAAYATWAGKRLPTEAEWEKAARSVDGREYSWGNNKPDGTQCNFADSHTFFPWSDESSNDGYKYTSPVGSFKSGGSPYGVHDMAGNVWEWCADRFDGDYYESSPKENPQGPSTGSTRVFRGGSWFNDARAVRLTLRRPGRPVGSYDMIGFRCACDAE